MPANIAWTDALGSASLDNGLVLCRFNQWEPRPQVVGQTRTLLATGAPRVWAYRRDYGAAFTLSQIPASRQLLMHRLAMHLGAGGTVAISTGDLASRTYPTCALAPGASPPGVKLTDRKLLHYSMDFALIDTSDTPQPMLCIYR